MEKQQMRNAHDKITKLTEWVEQQVECICDVDNWMLDLVEEVVQVG